MSLNVEIADTEATRQRVLAFREHVYDMAAGRLGLAARSRDEGERSLDETGTHYAITEGHVVLGAVRLVHLDDVADPDGLAERFAMRPALDEIGIVAICVVDRLVLDPGLRHGHAVLNLLQTVYKDARARAARLSYADCSPHLLPFYERLGYRRYTSGFQDTALGYKVPVIMLLCDQVHFRDVRSPLEHCDRADDAMARQWFRRSYPDYCGRGNGAVTASEPIFFDVLAERLSGDPLHAIALLRGLDRGEAERFLRHVTLIDFEPDSLIVREGEIDDTLFVLLSGLAEVGAGDPSRPPVAIIGAGDTFGEIGFLTAVPRTASVVARTECQVLVISGRFMQRFIAEEPDVGAKVLLSLARELAGRLAVASIHLAELG